jgi:predicted XRE-type DNA-binding protein
MSSDNTTLSPKDIERFWNKVNITSDDECWNWTASTKTNGYGQFKCNNQTYRTHRFAWMITQGYIPEGLLICHRCDNRLCCNPNHLFVGTHTDNMQDRAIKNRRSKLRRTHSIKLTDDQIREIRKSKLKQKDIAKRFDISQGQVSKILNRKRWTDMY